MLEHQKSALNSLTVIGYRSFVCELHGNWNRERVAFIREVAESYNKTITTMKKLWMPISISISSIVKKKGTNNYIEHLYLGRLQTLTGQLHYQPTCLFIFIKTNIKISLAWIIQHWISMEYSEKRNRSRNKVEEGI